MKKKYSLMVTGLLLISLLSEAQVDLQNTGILYASNSGDVLYINGNFTNTSAAALTNNGSLHVKQNLINDQASITIGTGTLFLNGSAAQAVNGSQTFKTYNLNTNNSTGITLNNNLSVTGTHTFTSGMITTSATPNYMIYEAGSSYAGNNDSRHVNGWVKKLGNTAFTFPVGNATWERTIGITGLSAASEFNAKYFSTTPNPTQVQLPLVTMDAAEYWALTKVSGGTASVAMNWNYSKVPFPNWILSSIAVANYNGSLWTDQGGSATGNVATTGAITSNSISSFNLLSFGSKTFVVPLTLVSFTAKPVNEHVLLEWKTMDENNVDHFSVERSEDGISYYSIVTQQARNSGNTESYSTNDYKPIHQVAFYRLRSTDKDGRYKLSSVVSIKKDNPMDQLVLLTNPVHDHITLLAGSQLKGVFDYKISMTNGQYVEKGKLTIDHGGQYNLLLKQNISPGVYILILSNSQKEYTFKLIKN